MGKGARLTVLDDKVHEEEDATDYVVLEIPGNLVSQLKAKLTELEAREATHPSGSNDRLCIHLHVKADNPFVGESLLRQPGDMNIPQVVKSWEERQKSQTDFFGFKRLSATDIAKRTFLVEPMPPGAMAIYDRDPDVAAIVAGYLVLWDPPTNKGTCGKWFSTREDAVAYSTTELEPSQWPMNIRILSSDEVSAFGLTEGYGLGDNTYRVVKD
jgi:hypothetical protein